MNKKTVSIFLALCVTYASSAAVTAAEDSEYIPLRKTFEDMGYGI